MLSVKISLELMNVFVIQDTPVRIFIMRIGIFQSKLHQFPGKYLSLYREIILSKSLAKY